MEWSQASPSLRVAAAAPRRRPDRVLGARSPTGLLQATVLRMLAAVRATDCVARKNRAGDELAVLLGDTRDVAMAQRLAERLQSRMREPIRLRSRDGVVDVDASISVVLMERGTFLTATDVVRIADARMRRGKSVGSGIVIDGDDELAFADRVSRTPSRI